MEIGGIHLRIHIILCYCHCKCPHQCRHLNTYTAPETLADGPLPCRQLPLLQSLSQTASSSSMNRLRSIISSSSCGFFLLARRPGPYLCWDAIVYLLNSCSVGRWVVLSKPCSAGVLQAMWQVSCTQPRLPLGKCQASCTLLRCWRQCVRSAVLS